jgi:acetamidase/formamidase/AraC-like DNA-binding protein
VNIRQFSTDSFPIEARRSAWRDAIAPHSIDAVFPPGDEGGFYGYLSTVASFAGVRFARARSRRQTLRESFFDRRDTIWLVLLIEGAASFMREGEILRMEPGDILCGRTRSEAALTLETDFTALLVDVPPQLLNPSLLAPLPSKVVLVPGDKGVGRVFSGMLNSVAEAIDTLELDEIRPIEIALPEFLLTSLFSEAAEGPLGGAASVRAAILHKILQTIEIKLADPELSLAEVAREHALPVRYVQKLLSLTGQGFSTYVRDRRLDRTKADLASPLHQQLSITDICLRWGFNDIAYFSRSFRDRFAMSPRQHRKAAGLSVALTEDAPRRGSPQLRRDRDTDDVPGPEDWGAGDAGPAVGGPLAPASEGGGGTRHYLPANRSTVHWGYFSRHIAPVLEVASGDIVTVETLTQHGGDDYDRMVAGDLGAESVYAWTPDHKAVDRRGAGPMKASIYGRGAGEGFGVHICTGPIAVRGAEPGDVLEIEVIAILPRPSAHPDHAGKSFGSNAATFWGLQYGDLLTEPKAREVVTIYEVDHPDAANTAPPGGGFREGPSSDRCACARALYSYRWTPQTDPAGVVHGRMDYPGVRVDPTTVERRYDILQGVQIPVRPHFGVIGLAPNTAGLVDSVPPLKTGGNIDNWRLGPGAKLYLPVEAPGALLSIGDPHASQGDGEFCGTALECSLTGVFRLTRHPKASLPGRLIDLDFPLIETPDAWVVLGFSHPDYLNELGKTAQSAVYSHSTLDAAVQNAFRQARRFLMSAYRLTEDEAISLLSVGVDIGVTQVVNGNKGAHAIIKKSLFDRPAS